MKVTEYDTEEFTHSLNNSQYQLLPVLCLSSGDAQVHKP